MILNVMTVVEAFRANRVIDSGEDQARNLRLCADGKAAVLIFKITPKYLTVAHLLLTVGTPIASLAIVYCTMTRKEVQALKATLYTTPTSTSYHFTTTHKKRYQVG